MPDPAPLVPMGTGSWDKAAMEVARIRATLTHLGHSTSETGQLQCESIVLNHHGLLQSESIAPLIQFNCIYGSILPCIYVYIFISLT